MPRVKIVRRRGSRAVIEAHGEVLMTPVGPVGIWTANLSRAITAAVKTAAPQNSRPYWGHYAGTKRLNQSITSTTDYDPATMHIHAAVGSSAAYALYVDQGTGIHAGKQPYQAAILPPWRRGEGSLYEATWMPGGPGTRRVGKVMIKGQRGQKFFERGLRFGMMARGVVPVTVPGDPSARLANQKSQILPNVPPPQMSLFRLQLEEWRIWRDKAWAAGEMLGKDGGKTSKYARLRAQAAKQKTKAPKAKKAATAKPTRPKKPKATKPTKPTPPAKPKGDNSGTAIIARIKEEFTKQGHRNVTVTLNPNTGVATIKYRSRQGSIQKVTRAIGNYVR